MRWLVLALSVLGACGRAAEAQWLQPELRLDVLGPAPASVEPGVGATARMGQYVRAGVAVGYDVSGLESRAGRRWRGDLIARVTLDPFREQRVALSLGGGLSFRGARTYLAALLDLEGPEVRGIVPAVQVGVSGGGRAGLILRRALRGRR